MESKQGNRSEKHPIATRRDESYSFQIIIKKNYIVNSCVVRTVRVDR